MISIRELQEKSKKTTGKVTIPSGKYHSVVLSVSEPEEYAPGEKVVIRYELTDAEEKRFQFQEEFLLRHPPERTKDFLDYLAEYGINEFEDFIGCEEEVEIRLRRGKYRDFPSIINRDMVAIPVEE